MVAFKIINPLFSIYLLVGTEFETTACPVTGVMHHMEIQVESLA
jgi:hypothetical protein